jgi:hypothetical protein
VARSLADRSPCRFDAAARITNRKPADLKSTVDAIEASKELDNLVSITGRHRLADDVDGVRQMFGMNGDVRS